MLNKITRALSRKVLGIVLSASLMAGCAPVSPDPTTVQPTIQPTWAPTIRTPSSSGAATAASPIPTPAPAFAAPLTAPAPTAEPPEEGLAASGLVSYDPGESELLTALESLPLEFAERGIWFANPKQSLEVSGAPRPRDLEDFESLPEDQRQEWARNSGGGVSNLFITVRQTMPDWEHAYGFSFFEVDAITVTGMYNYMVLETNHITGQFDEETIVQSLTELGYRTESAGDDVYYAIRDDFEQDLSLTNPATRGALGNANRIYVGDDLLVVSPDTPPVLQFLRTRNGEAPSVANYPAFTAIAAELSDPITAALLTREATLDPELGIPRDQVPGSADRPEEWEVMHEWKAFGAGVSKTRETTALRFSPYYPHRHWAELDAETLVERIESYLPGLGRLELVHQFCEAWSPVARVHGNGSTLTVTCEVPTGEESLYLLRRGHQPRAHAAAGVPESIVPIPNAGRLTGKGRHKMPTSLQDLLTPKIRPRTSPVSERSGRTWLGLHLPKSSAE